MCDVAIKQQEERDKNYYVQCAKQIVHTCNCNSKFCAIHFAREFIRGNCSCTGESKNIIYFASLRNEATTLIAEKINAAQQCVEIANADFEVVSKTFEQAKIDFIDAKKLAMFDGTRAGKAKMEITKIIENIVAILELRNKSVSDILSKYDVDTTKYKGPFEKIIEIVDNGIGSKHYRNWGSYDNDNPMVNIVKDANCIMDESTNIYNTSKNIEENLQRHEVSKKNMDDARKYKEHVEKDIHDIKKKSYESIKRVIIFDSHYNEQYSKLNYCSSQIEKVDIMEDLKHKLNSILLPELFDFAIDNTNLCDYEKYIIFGIYGIFLNEYSWTDIEFSGQCKQYLRYLLLDSWNYFTMSDEEKTKREEVGCFTILDGDEDLDLSVCSQNCVNDIRAILQWNEMHETESYDEDNTSNGDKQSFNVNEIIAEYMLTISDANKAIMKDIKINADHKRHAVKNILDEWKLNAVASVNKKYDENSNACDVLVEDTDNRNSYSADSDDDIIAIKNKMKVKIEKIKNVKLMKKMRTKMIDEIDQLCVNIMLFIDADEIAAIANLYRTITVSRAKKYITETNDAIKIYSDAVSKYDSCKIIADEAEKCIKTDIEFMRGRSFYRFRDIEPYSNDDMVKLANIEMEISEKITDAVKNIVSFASDFTESHKQAVVNAKIYENATMQFQKLDNELKKQKVIVSKSIAKLDDAKKLSIDIIMDDIESGKHKKYSAIK